MELTAEEAGKIVCDAYGYKGEIEIKEQRVVDPQRFLFDVAKAKNMLSFSAEYDFKAGMADMMKEVSGDEHRATNTPTEA